MNAKTLYRTFYKATVLVVVVVPIFGTVFGIYQLWDRAVHWPDVALMLLMYMLTAMGVTMGFHRMLTHRSFEAHPAVKFLLLVFGSMALEGPAIQWAATHVKHHAQADREGDPHSPLEGFFHAHIGWLFKDDMAEPSVYCRHLLKDPIVMFVSRTFLLWVVLSLLIPLAIGGWYGLLWGGLVRIFLTHHVTWSVNSVCHTFGKRQFETTDQSRNEWIVGLLAFGEGWHNNHHAFPRSAFHGLSWWQFDMSGYVIRLLERVGLVHDVYRVSPETLARRSLKATS
ncbi:MAG: acyl-CoA desaturase, partial [Chloroflexi bacterium]